MSTHTFDAAAFRAQFPAFADVTKYPDALLASYFEMAACYINPNDGCVLSGNCLQLALNLLTAHLAAVYAPDANGQTNTGGGIVTSATIDRVSVQNSLPKSETAWQSFLARTVYGVQLRALLSVKAVGGWLIGGSIERQGIRKAGGVF
jgi:hypothetical protein